MTTPTDADGNEETMLAEIEAWFEQLAEDPKAFAAYRAESREISKLIDRHSGCLDTDGDIHARVEGLRDEWR
jgi:hypothetical protein